LFKMSTAAALAMAARMQGARLKPGMSPHAPHQHPEEEFMVITEGAGKISLGGRITKVSPGSMMYCAAMVGPVTLL
jgi:uncharacterized cupin superfamily protein